MNNKDDLSTIRWKLSFLKQDIIKDRVNKESIIRQLEDIQDGLNQIYIKM